MREGLRRLGENKLAVAGCIILVALLTGIGLLANHTRERQNTVEHHFKVIRTKITKALCKDGPTAKECREHAIDVVRACLVTPECVALLRKAEEGIHPTQGKPRPSPGNLKPSNLSSGEKEMGEKQGKSHPAPPNPAPHGEPPHHPSHQHHGHHGPRHHPTPPPAPAPPGPSGPTPPPESIKTLPNGKPYPGKGEAKGLLECVQPVDVECVGEAVGHAVEGVAEDVGSPNSE